MDRSIVGFMLFLVPVTRKSNFIAFNEIEIYIVLVKARLYFFLYVSTICKLRLPVLCRTLSYKLINKSLIRIMESRRPRGEPCGTPLFPYLPFSLPAPNSPWRPFIRDFSSEFFPLLHCHLSRVDHMFWFVPSPCNRYVASSRSFQSFFFETHSV